MGKTPFANESGENATMISDKPGRSLWVQLRDAFRSSLMMRMLFHRLGRI